MVENENEIKKQLEAVKQEGESTREDVEYVRRRFDDFCLVATVCWRVLFIVSAFASAVYAAISAIFSR